MIAANANIGVAKAAYFPDISLTAALGLESAQLSDLFKGTSKAWSFGGNLTQPIFNAGLTRSQVAQAEAVQRQALYGYRKSIISAFQDVEDALVDRTKFDEARVEQVKNVYALQRFRDLAALRYKEGATIYLEVSSAEQALFSPRFPRGTQSQPFQSYANLYRAMGGGWVADAEKLASNPPPAGASKVVNAEPLSQRSPSALWSATDQSGRIVDRSARPCGNTWIQWKGSRHGTNSREGCRRDSFSRRTFRSYRRVQRRISRARTGASPFRSDRARSKLVVGRFHPPPGHEGDARHSLRHKWSKFDTNWEA